MQKRRSMFLGLMGLAILPLAGCMSKPLRTVNADGTYCFKVSKSRDQTCTAQPVPGNDIAQEANRFLAAQDALTVYVVRHRWGDTLNQVPVAVDNGVPFLTIPESVVRLRLPAGSHRISFNWDGFESAQVVEGQGGDVRFVQLVGTVWAWGSNYRWEIGDDEEARTRAAKSKLIADIRIR